MFGGGAAQDFNNFMSSNQVVVDDSLYDFDADTYEKEVLDKKPWRNDPFYFKHVKVSLLALIKILEHANAGGIIEVMGLLRGKVDGRTFIVTDAFPLPVEASETRVNAGNEALEYIGKYGDLCETL
jgi:COP9 signalosome complex subunit 5